MSKDKNAAKSARNTTHTAPTAPTDRASAMRGVVIWRKSTQPNPADMSGVSVKIAAVDTGGAVFSASNISTK